MVDIGSHVRVVWNGAVVYDALIEPDIALIDSDYQQNGERKNIYVAVLTFTR